MDKQTQKNLLELVKRNYQEIAAEFNQSRSKYLWPEIIKLTDSVADGSKILDVGCGNGRLLEILKDKKINYIGVDNSQNLINIAKSRYKNINHKSKILNLKFQIGDILELGKIAEINFDYVFCLAVLHHLPGRGLRVAALKQLKNKVNSDGKIIISVWNLWQQPKYRRLIVKFILLKLMKKNSMDIGDIIFAGFAGQSRRYYHAFTKRQLKKIIKQAGLRIIRLDKDKHNYYAVLRK